jgi:hypothetical protein
MPQGKEVRLRIDVYRDRPLLYNLRVDSSPISLSLPHPQLYPATPMPASTPRI